MGNFLGKAVVFALFAGFFGYMSHQYNQGFFAAVHSTLEHESELLERAELERSIAQRRQRDDSLGLTDSPEDTAQPESKYKPLTPMHRQTGDIAADVAREPSDEFEVNIIDVSPRPSVRTPLYRRRSIRTSASARRRFTTRTSNSSRSYSPFRGSDSYERRPKIRSKIGYPAPH